MKARLRTLTTLAAIAGCAALVPIAAADTVIYRIPGIAGFTILQGKTTVHPGRTVSYQHPKFGKLIFALENCRIIEGPSTASLVRRDLARAGQAKDAAATMAAAARALKHGLLPLFHEAVDEALAIDPASAAARNVAALRKKIETPLPESPTLEAELRKLVPNPGMQVARSKHFILLHDTSSEPLPHHKLPRAEERLALLEQVYESFLMKFYLHGVRLQVPPERMKVVLFNHHGDYLRFAERLSPGLSSASGFWVHSINVSVFYDHGTSERFKQLQRFSQTLQDAKARSLRQRSSVTKDIVRMANTIGLLVQVAQENADIEVVSHEATHQMAGNTGLFPRNVSIPVWVHEGLASYFEAPDDATWSGMGAVNERRLKWYRALESDRKHSNIGFIVGDEIFTNAGSISNKLHAYGQSWALTHFLIDRHFDEYVDYCKNVGQLPADLRFSPDVLRRVFDESFELDQDALDAEWRAYMRTLKTDVELLLGAQAKKR